MFRIFCLAEYIEAREYETSLRGPPALYNERRLSQRPIPRMPSLSRLNPIDRELLAESRGKSVILL